MLIVVPISLVLHMFAAFHISYYKRKYQKQDDTVYSIQLRPQRNDDPDDNKTLNLRKIPLKLNTSNYNEILFEVSTMALFSLVLIIFLILIFCITSPATGMPMGMIYLSHFADTLMMLTLNLVLPCTVCICNRNLRLFVKSHLCQRK